MSDYLSVQTTQNVALELPLAPLGERVLACLIDWFIRGAIAVVMMLLYGMFFDDGGFLGTERFLLLFFVLLLPVILYHLLFEIFNHGQSPGKRVFHLRVVSLRGDSVSIGAYFLRYIFRLVDFQIFSGLVALICVASTEKNQRVGDLVAGTTVIKENRRVQFHQLAYDEVRPQYVPEYPQARTLTPAHIELIKETLNNFHLESSDPHVQLLADKTARMLDVTYASHPRKFLRTIVNDYSESSRRM